MDATHNSNTDVTIDINKLEERITRNFVNKQIKKNRANEIKTLQFRIKSADANGKDSRFLKFQLETLNRYDLSMKDELEVKELAVYLKKSD